MKMTKLNTLIFALVSLVLIQQIQTNEDNPDDYLIYLSKWYLEAKPDDLLNKEELDFLCNKLDIPNKHFLLNIFDPDCHTCIRFMEPLNNLYDTLQAHYG